MVKILYSSKHHKYGVLKYYLSRQTTPKVKKYFMSDKEFLSIYELYCNIDTNEDALFVIQLIETSKTYKHYKFNKIRYIGQSNPLLNLYEELNFNKHNLHRFFDAKFALQPIMEWLFAHTIHTNSLNSVSFK